DTFLLGIEAAAAYASHAATKLHQSGRSNGLLLVDNGKLYLRDRVPPQSLHAVHVYYPDPWPKRRHRGRRFFTDEVRDTLADVLVDDGLLLIATDNPAYAGAIVRVLGSAPAFERDTTAEQQLQALGPGFAFSPTNFEKKYLEAGRILRRYAFRRVAR
ncbi:MAG TPA: tRNA (guanosine(46)-N7)-methyltransferase TrmB, partial [Planctomycetota bacterium]|nr:tRNA (guanosine(46)-N7)-methyltransferase TrmB [Planctomycetota bacterium]